MPLPDQNVVWPPPHMGAVLTKYAEWSAWYSGDPAQLRDVYSNNRTGRTIARPAQYAGGVGGALARFWWGRPQGDLTKRNQHLHIPLAADLCQASADLLFAEPPTLKAKNSKTQDLLDELADDDLFTTLAEGAELSAALGGNYQRVTWDRESRPEGAFIMNVDADGAVPEFRWGRLSAVTFWWEMRTDGRDEVWRHLERHELDAKGVGVILHGLYQGTSDNLGRVKPLAEHPATAGLAAFVDDESKISTESPGLAVEYFPNQTPQRVLRKDPVGRHLGRSDFSGSEGELDALDETWSSWMRDVRLAKARIIVPAFMLQSEGRGKGAFFDLDQEAYETLNVPPSADGTGQTIEFNKFKVDYEAHSRTAHELTAVILRSAGYSLETFGEGESGGMKTATEVVSEQNRSYLSRDRKIRLIRPRTARLLEKLLAVDKAIFSKPIEVELPNVEFADGVQSDPEALARTASLLRTAQAASTQVLVAMQHPDWDQEQIDQEVALIVEQNTITIPELPPFPESDGAANHGNVE